MSSERSIEVKVGALVVTSLVILAAFVLVMGGISFQKTFPVLVDFDYPGGLQAGAPVRIAGVKVGKVEALEFRGNKVDPTTGKRALVRARLSIEARVHETIHEDADFYVTTQGVLGEQFLAIDPGSPERPLIAEGAVVRGLDPPRLDLFLAKGYELLDVTITGLRNNRQLVGDLVTNVAGLSKGLNEVLSAHRERIDRTMVNVETLTQELVSLARDARSRVDDPRVERTLDNVDKLSSTLRADAGPLLDSAKKSLANLEHASAAVGSPEQQEKVRRILNDVTQLAERANAMAGDAQALVTKVRAGKGTAGRLVADEEMYEDLQELVRDLKHNPWKLFWKP